MPLELVDLTSGVLAFVQDRRKDKGGYGATPKLPATIEDTYHALRIITTLKIQESAGLYQDTALRGYLSGFQETEWMGARTTFQFLAASSLARVPVDIPQAVSIVEGRLAARQSPEELYYRTRIIREIPGLANALMRVQPDDLHDPIIWRVASELWMILYQRQGKAGGQGPASRDDLIAWLQSCQSCDGGFGFLPHSTSFMENCHTCLRALAFLDAAPRNPEACRSFILSCRAKSGGFARAIRATAFLYSTWDAIASLSLLGALE